ncbi:MAG: hypothetical protein GWM98_28625, partial [Nitrospinaceae bacterium]|nr:hypothetical protein [Nitrospinaceae bacterium]NIR57695.1 hypothetical protein [Nitrospinaceae bacterium]NIS88159.1 hypothetical protein [Nitrospinaceae bacterium]NIT85037.1 hypothetical protein [Nitrospinaceae bacterium]NIU47199.1 hypothetical protein [Nitrospinaceae bacterium]
LLILGLILAIMVSDGLFEGAWVALHPEAASPSRPLGLALGAALQTLPPAANVFLHNLGYWV